MIRHSPRSLSGEQKACLLTWAGAPGRVAPGKRGGEAIEMAFLMSAFDPEDVFDFATPTTWQRLKTSTGGPS